MKMSKCSALVVIDLQQGIVDQLPETVSRPIIENSLALCDAFDDADLPVIIVNVAGRPQGRTELQNKAAQPDASKIVWGEVIESLRLNPNYRYLTKYSWGAFTNTDLQKQLCEQGITDIYLTGVATSIGVESTARQAFELGYNVVIVEDAIADMNPMNHQHSCQNIFPKLSVLAKAQDLL
ncbi:isochorismatase family cysteine hydrolase [Vibrio sp. 10N.222.54.B12]|jgi:nicotinamidase-related amidase|uniref:isochorismatase family cysteine hydrolase n=2 Tax=Vibrio TaxID=662 RepID=UPI0002E6D993|nr:MULTISPECIES: isochorismatase family cysteine hydrolase [Vibrio]ANP77254.1 hypothetical protein A134_12820 [Vibrio crassostreae 9CS106]OEE88191.1 hypothetical protein A140_20690 [Vibrio crassostreae 9ZC88]OEE95333.1 hypothetical protein A138_04215 [Vibrio crassostreae 9ZC77]PMK17535.1 hypothetical protein BCU05_19015 [Vibrio sp. 10N.261.54.C3]PML65950.1 hypothetical protein BCT71_20445 [Vibrio sp. 10N.261.51.A7]PMN97318.1 hypothetical protein BCT21_14780 [Vibrio sp. 10N.222.55.F9]PMN97734